MNKLTLYDILPTITEVIENGAEAIFTPGGVSMRPMLRGGIDEVAIVKAHFPLKKFDIPLYRRKNGTIVLHRVVAVKGGNYIMRGDNTYCDESGIQDNNVIAVVSRFKRKGKWHSADEKAYLVYCRVWCLIYPLRKLFYRVKTFIIRCLSNVKHNIFNK